jgi:transcriptional regulator with XRE-family HTH domain
MLRGRRALLSVLQILPESEVAARVHVSQAAVSYWASGRYVPSNRARLELEAHCEIEAVLWEAPDKSTKRH